MRKLVIDEAPRIVEIMGLHCFKTTPIAASIALFQVAVEAGAGFHVLVDLHTAFLDGRLHATHSHYGPMCEDHAAACAVALRDLAAAGVLTHDGQQRVYNSDECNLQRAYSAGSFILAKTIRIEDVRAIMDDTGLCYRVFVEYPEETRMLQRLLGDDADRSAAASTTFDSDVDLDLAQSDVDLDLVQDTILDPICVTLDDGKEFTWVHLEKDVYNLKSLRQGPVVSFFIWEPEWLGSRDSEPELALLRCLKARGHGVVYSG